MENENVGEQPILDENLELCEQVFEKDGSPYGKFESVKDLKEAYQNLEKEFTRKSQMLKEFQKKAENFSNEENTNVMSDIENSLTAEDTLNEVADIDEKEVKIPYWERPDWNKQVQDFLKDNPLAKNYAKQISQMVMEDKELFLSKFPLQSAWAKWLQKNYKTPEQLLDDQEFLEKVKQNEKVRRAIIKDYVASFNKREETPPIFAHSQGVGVESQKQTSPKTLEDIKELARKIFSK